MKLCSSRGASHAEAEGTKKLLQQFGVDEAQTARTNSFIKEWTTDKNSQVEALCCLERIAYKLDIPLFALEALTARHVDGPPEAMLIDEIRDFLLFHVKRETSARVIAKDNQVSFGFSVADIDRVESLVGLMKGDSERATGLLGINAGAHVEKDAEILRQFKLLGECYDHKPTSDSPEEHLKGVCAKIELTKIICSKYKKIENNKKALDNLCAITAMSAQSHFGEDPTDGVKEWRRFESYLDLTPGLLDLLISCMQMNEFAVMKDLGEVMADLKESKKLDSRVIQGVISIAQGEVAGIEDISALINADATMMEGFVLVASADGPQIRSSQSAGELISKLGLDPVVLRALLALNKGDMSGADEICFALGSEMGLNPKILKVSGSELQNQTCNHF